MTRHSTLSIAAAVMAAAAIMASNPGTSGAWAQAAPASPNYSSHAAAFFTACSKAASGSWSGRTRGVPETAIPSGRIITARTARFAPAPISEAPMRPEPRAAGGAVPRVPRALQFHRAGRGTGSRTAARPHPGLLRSRHGRAAQRGAGVRVRRLGSGFARLGSGKLAPGDEGCVPGLGVTGGTAGQREADLNRVRQGDGTGSGCARAGPSGFRTARTGSDRHRGLRGPCNPAGGGAQALP